MTSTADTIAELLLRVSTEGGEKIAAMGAQLGALDGQIKTLTLRETEAGTTITASAKAVESSGMTAEVAAKKITGLGIAFGGAGVAVGLFSADMAAKFQASMELIHTQAGASQAEVERLSSAILNLSTQTATGPEQLAASLYHVESAGFRSSAALDMVKAAAMGAKIGQADLETTTQAMVAAMASGISGISGAQDAMAQLNAVVGTGDMRMQALALAMGTGILSAGANAGLSFRDVGAALATLTDNAVPADEAATRLRMTIALMEAPSKKAQTALAEVGLSSIQLASDMRQQNGLLVAVDDLKTHLEASGLSAVRQSQIITEAFGGGRSSSAIETLINEFDRLKSKYGEQAALVGQFGDAWTKTQQTVSYDLAQLQADTERLAIEIGQGLLPQVDALAKGLIPVADGLAKVSAQHKTATADAFDFAAAILAGSFAIRGFMLVFGPYKEALATLVGLLPEAAAGVALTVAPFAALAATIGIGVKETHDASVTLQENISWLEKHRDALTSDQQALLAQYKANSDSRGLWQAVTREMPQMTDEVKKHETATRADTAANQEYAAQRASQADQERKATEATDADTAAHIRHKKSLDDEVTSYDSLQKVLKKYQDEANAGLEAIAAKLVRHQQITQADLDAVRNAEAGQSRWNDALSRAQGLVDGDTEALSRFTSAMKTLEDQGLVSHTASMAAFADVGISQAQRMHAGVVSEVQAMMKEVATAEAFNPIAAPSILGGPAPIVTTATEHSHSTDSGTPAASEITPEAQQALADLNKTIQALPPELQSLLSGVSGKFSSDIQTSYNSFLDKYNAENTRDAAAKQAIVNDEHQKIADAYASAESKDKADHDEYLSKLKALQDSHNQDLSSRLTTFVQQFQQVLADFQASLAIEQTKAGDITQAHNDNLRQLYDDYTSKLQGIHGKNADERKQALEAQYSRAVQLEDAHYRNSIKSEEQHITGMTGAFDRHVKGMDSSFNQGVSKSEASYRANQEALANGYLAHVTGIKTALDASVKKSEQSAGTSLSKEATIHTNHVDSLNAAFEKHVASLSASLEKGLDPSKLLATLQSGAQSAENVALAQATLDELNTGSVSGPDQAALALATGNLNELSGAEAKAKATVDSVNLSLHNFGQYLSDLQTTLKTDEETVAGLLLHPKQGSQPLPPAPGEPQSIYAQEPKESKLTGSIDTMVEDAKKLHDAQDKETQAELILAQRTGDTATAFQLVTQQFEQGKATLQQYTAAELANAQRQKGIDDQKQLADLQVAQQTGDTAKALSILTDRYNAGEATLAQVTAAYQANQSAVSGQTDRTIALDEATGQYSDALRALTDGPTKAYSDALAKVTLDFLQHGSASQSDIASTAQARESRDRLTSATWDATFATSSLADQSKMLSQRFSELVSHQNTIDSAQSSVDSANIAIIAAQSTLAVDGINAEAKATEDLAGIIGKEDAVRSASASGQIAAITDQTKYISDSTAVLKATSPEAIRVAQQQLLIDQVTAQEHRAEAAWQVRLASDALRTEQDKARGDQAAAAAQIRVAGDALQVATDQRQLAVDQQQLTLDQLDVLTDIDSAIGGVNDYGDQIKSDLAALSSDKQSISSDQTSLGDDTASANAIAAYNAQQAAMDSLLTAYDQSGSSSTSQDFQLRLAYLEQQKALYQVAVDQLSTQQQMASNLGAYSGQLQQMLFDFMGLLNLPAVRKNVVGMGTAQQMNGRGYDVQTITTVTPS